MKTDKDFLYDEIESLMEQRKTYIALRNKILDDVFLYYSRNGKKRLREIDGNLDEIDEKISGLESSAASMTDAQKLGDQQDSSDLELARLYQDVTLRMLDVVESELTLTEKQRAEVVDEILTNPGYYYKAPTQEEVAEVLEPLLKNPPW